MSGIAGIFHLDGRVVDGAVLGRMLDSMAHRGPDGRAAWREEAVGLGHCMLHTTPESLHEALPFTNLSGTLTITADARIDNRDDLARLLGLTSTVRDVSDSELILRAYERWGEDCVEHLVGDFAFVIWNASTRRLFCARDHFGVRPFYYFYEPGRLFAFASEIKALFCLDEIEEELDDLAIAEFLTRKLSDDTRTVFKDIRKLHPAFTLGVSLDGVRTRRYWELDVQETRGLSDGEYEARFLEHFTEAVRCRLRSAFPVASELSGGLDSSFVTCVARDLMGSSGALPLHSISLVYDIYKECDERHFIDKVVDGGGLQPHFVPVEEESLPQLLDDIYGYMDDGRAGGNHHLNWLTSRAASQSGARVLLTGQDGDTTVYHGWQYFIELGKAGKWSEFAYEAEQAVARMRTEQDAYAMQETFRSKVDVLNAYGGRHLRRWAREGEYFRFVRLAREVSKHFELPQSVIYKRYWRDLAAPVMGHVRKANAATPKAPSKSIPPVVNDRLAADVGLREHLASLQQQNTEEITVRGAQRRTLGSPELMASFDKFGSYSAAWGVEARHPFMDKRLVEFCVSLPPDQSLKNGWTRAIMRRAMADIVPEEVRWRVGKTNLEAPYRHLLLRRDPARLARLMDKVDLAGRYLDTAFMRAQYGKGEAMSSAELSMFGLGVSLVAWLARRASRSVIPESLRAYSERNT